MCCLSVIFVNSIILSVLHLFLQCLVPPTPLTAVSPLFIRQWNAFVCAFSLPHRQQQHVCKHWGSAAYLNHFCPHHRAYNPSPILLLIARLLWVEIIWNHCLLLCYIRIGHQLLKTHTLFWFFITIININFYHLYIVVVGWNVFIPQKNKKKQKEKQKKHHLAHP